MRLHLRNLPGNPQQFWKAVVSLHWKGTMKRGTDKTDLFPGILQGDGHVLECKCTVVMVTKLLAGSSSNAVSTTLHIDSTERATPDGNYRLNVRGRIFKLCRVGGQWPLLSL